MRARDRDRERLLELRSIPSRRLNRFTGLRFRRFGPVL
jgi:hypothetical protein